MSRTAWLRASNALPAPPGQGHMDSRYCYARGQPGPRTSGQANGRCRLPDDAYRFILVKTLAVMASV